VRPDFGEALVRNLLRNLAQILGNFCGNFEVKAAVLTFAATLGKIGQHFIPITVTL